MKLPARILTLVLAGGEGGRLDVLTAERAKPAMPYAGVYRLIDFPLSNCHHSGLSDVWVLQQYEPHSLSDHLANGRPWDLDRTHGGLRVLHPYTGDEESGWYGGNADAIYRNRDPIEEFDADLLVVLSADHVYKLDYTEVVRRHLELGAAVTMVTTRVSLEEAGRFGTVRVGDGDRVSEYVYKPDEPQSDVATTEVFVFDARGLLEALADLAGEGSDDGLEDLGQELLPRLVSGGRAFAYPLDGYWRDVGTIESYWKAHMELLQKDSPFQLDDPSWPVFTQSPQRPPARASATARLEDALVSPGCSIEGEVVRSVLGPGVFVAEGATVRDSVLLSDASVREGARLESSIVDSDVEVGEEAEIGAPARRDAASPDDIAVVGMAADVAAGSRVPPGARVPAEARGRRRREAGLPRRPKS